MANGVRLDTRYMVSSMGHGLWYMVYGTWYMVQREIHGIW